MSALKIYFSGIALLLVGFASAQAAGDDGAKLSTMSAEQKKQEQQYFTSHSFEFSPIFKSHHPGPYWILEHVKQLQLSSAQIKQQEDLKLGMAESTISGNRALRSAYKKYAADASEIEPSLTVIERDIAEIGKAQTQLALAMVPYHLKAYAALNPAQQVIYRELVAKQH